MRLYRCKFCKRLHTNPCHLERRALEAYSVQVVREIIGATVAREALEAAKGAA